MKICLVVNTFPAISETFIINKVKGLAARGHTVHVVCSDRKTADGIFSKYGLGAPNIIVHTLRIERNIGHLLSNLVASPSLLFTSFALSPNVFLKKYLTNYYLSFFGKIDYEILHFEFSGVGVRFLDVIDKLKGKKLVSCRGSAEKVKPLIEPKRKEALTSLFSKVDLVHCVAEDMQRTIAPYCKDASKIFINRPAIDLSFFSNSQVSYAEKPRYQLLSVGRLTYAKGYVTGLLTVRDLVAKGYNVALNIIGDGPDMEEILFHVQQMKLENHVVVLGKKTRDEVKSFIEQSDVFLLTSYFEGLPNVALEAMAMQLPVVSTKCGGVEEAIAHGEDGFIADVYDHAKLAEHVAALLDNANLRKEIGAAARKKVLDDFTLERQMDVFEKSYKKLLAQTQS